MSSPPVTGSIGETASEIARKMAESRVGSVIILQDSKPIGLVTDGDLVIKVLAKDRKPTSMIAKEILTKPLRTVTDDDDVTEAARRMRRYGMKRLGVMKAKELIGVVSMSDIASVAPDLLELLSERARVSGVEIESPSAGLLSGVCDNCERWSPEIQEIEGKFICEECRGDRSSESGDI